MIGLNTFLQLMKYKALTYSRIIITEQWLRIKAVMFKSLSQSSIVYELKNQYSMVLERYVTGNLIKWNALFIEKPSFPLAQK